MGRICVDNFDIEKVANSTGDKHSEKSKDDYLCHSKKTHLSNTASNSFDIQNNELLVKRRSRTRSSISSIYGASSRPSFSSQFSGNFTRASSFSSTGTLNYSSVFHDEYKLGNMESTNRADGNNDDHNDDDNDDDDDDNDSESNVDYSFLPSNNYFSSEYRLSFGRQASEAHEHNELTTTFEDEEEDDDDYQGEQEAENDNDDDHDDDDDDDDDDDGDEDGDDDYNNHSLAFSSSGRNYSLTPPFPFKDKTKSQSNVMIYRCQSCYSDICISSLIISKDFWGNKGEAYFVKDVLNVREDNKEVLKHMRTGQYGVKSIYCVQCDKVLGWKYITSIEPTERYKVNKYVIEKNLLKTYKISS